MLWEARGFLRYSYPPLPFVKAGPTKKNFNSCCFPPVLFFYPYSFPLNKKTFGGSQTLASLSLLCHLFLSDQKVILLVIAIFCMASISKKQEMPKTYPFDKGLAAFNLTVQTKKNEFSDCQRASLLTRVCCKHDCTKNPFVKDISGTYPFAKGLAAIVKLYKQKSFCQGSLWHLPFCQGTEVQSF